MELWVTEWLTNVVVQLLSHIWLFATPGLQHIRLPCLSLSPKVCSNSCPLSQWYNANISSSVTPVSSCLQSFPASGSFPMSQLFASGGQNIGASTSASVLPVNIQGWFLVSPSHKLGSLEFRLQFHKHCWPSPCYCSAAFTWWSKVPALMLVPWQHPSFQGHKHEKSLVFHRNCLHNICLCLIGQKVIIGSQRKVREPGKYSLLKAARYTGVLLFYKSRIDVGQQLAVLIKIT